MDGNDVLKSEIKTQIHRDLVCSLLSDIQRATTILTRMSVNKNKMNEQLFTRANAACKEFKLRQSAYLLMLPNTRRVFIRTKAKEKNNRQLAQKIGVKMERQQKANCIDLTGFSRVCNFFDNFFSPSQTIENLSNDGTK